jgi:hypothetical protein
MKKLFFGCLIFVMLFGAAAAVGGYLFVWKPLQAVTTDWGECVTNLRDIREMDEALENRAAFEEPKDGLLSEEVVERFVEVQRAISVAQAEHETLRERMDGLRDRGDLSYEELVAAFVEFSGALRGAKVEQIIALNAHDFSLEEYRWVRHAFFAAAGVGLVPFEAPELPAFEFNLDGLSRLQDFGGLDRLRYIGGSVSDSAPTVPDENQELVRPYREECRGWIAHATLGL